MREVGVGGGSAVTGSDHTQLTEEYAYVCNVCMPGGGRRSEKERDRERYAL